MATLSASDSAQAGWLAFGSGHIGDPGLISAARDHRSDAPTFPVRQPQIARSFVFSAPVIAAARARRSGQPPSPPPAWIDAQNSGAAASVRQDTIATAGSGSAGAALPGREADARVAAVAYRLALAGSSRCPRRDPATGLVLQHLSQFERADRPPLVAAYHLDRGPGVVAVVPTGPAAAAGLRAGDVVLAAHGAPIAPDADASLPFDQSRARARTDLVLDQIAAAGAAPVELTILRDGALRPIRIAAQPACPSRVHLARSNQTNAYADGVHVFVTTGLLAQLRSDDELAFVLAHEMAHNILRHAAIMRGGEVRRGLGRTFGRSGKLVRSAEREADALGGELMLDAGYDPVAGAGVLRRLGGADLGIALFSGHEGAGARVAAMRALAAARGR